MKTGEIRDPGSGTAYLETDGWTPWLYHMPGDELERYYRDANALMMKLERMPPAVRARLEHIMIRCPVKGCLLATIYWVPRRPTSEELEDHHRLRKLRYPDGRRVFGQECRAGNYLYVGRTADGTEVYDILSYGFPSTYKDEARGCTCCRIVYWRAGCRHGTASLQRHDMHDMFSIARRVLGPMRTEEQEVAGLPDHLRKSWGRRVFHPAPQAWHPKKRQCTSDRQDLRPPRNSGPLGGRQ